MEKNKKQNLSFQKKVTKLGTLIKKRWVSETPRIYKRVRNTATVFAFAIPIAANVDNAPKWFTTYQWYLSSGSAIIAGCSQLTKKKDSDGDTIIVNPKDLSNNSNI